MAVAVSSRTLNTYEGMALRLATFARQKRLDVNEQTLDGMVAAWMNNEFQSCSMIATAKFFFPAFGRGGGTKLPLASQALKGWHVRAPATSRRPLLEELVMLMALEMGRVSGSLYSVYVLLTYHAYLRPCEALRVQRADVTPPAIGRCKFWSVVLHPAERHPPLKRLLKHAEGAKLFPFSRQKRLGCQSGCSLCTS
eukprot:1200333-Amphidinium_carterae.1